MCKVLKVPEILMPGWLEPTVLGDTGRMKRKAGTCKQGCAHGIYSMKSVTQEFEPMSCSQSVFHRPGLNLISFFCRTIRPNSAVRSIYKASGCSDNPNHHVNYLEHVVVRITITHPRRGDLAIYLTSPSGTRSQLLANRYGD